MCPPSRNHSGLPHAASGTFPMGGVPGGRTAVLVTTVPSAKRSNTNSSNIFHGEMYVCERLCKWPGRMHTKAVSVYSFYKWRESGTGDKTQRESQGHLRKRLISLCTEKGGGAERDTMLIPGPLLSSPGKTCSWQETVRTSETKHLRMFLVASDEPLPLGTVDSQIRTPLPASAGPPSARDAFHSIHSQAQGSPALMQHDHPWLSSGE